MIALRKKHFPRVLRHYSASGRDAPLTTRRNLGMTATTSSAYARQGGALEFEPVFENRGVETASLDARDSARWIPRP